MELHVEILPPFNVSEPLPLNIPPPVPVEIEVVLQLSIEPPFMVIVPLANTATPPPAESEAQEDIDPPSIVREPPEIYTPPPLPEIEEFVASQPAMLPDLRTSEDPVDV